MRNRRAWGFIVDISENSSANTPTPYLLTAAVRLRYLRDGETESSFVWVRVPTYTPNCLTSVDAPIYEGTPIFGILLPTFGDSPNAACATWEVGTLAQWRSEGTGPASFTSDIDPDPWSRAPLPSPAASGFFAKKTPPRIAGMRIKPPRREARGYTARMSENVCEPGPTSLSLSLSRRGYFLNEGGPPSGSRRTSGPRP